ncbi:RNA-directed DNA polymerase, eukaryota, reverse transcriptase zinc-binding domain protein, partial [Tanacetum coccineum]
MVNNSCFIGLFCRMKDLHYGGVLVRGPVTEYRDYDYVSMEREKNRVCLWSFTTELRSLGFKDCDVNGVYYKEPLKTLTNGMKLIYDQATLYDMFSCASRTGVVELYVEHSEEWLRANKKLVDYNYTTEMSFDQSTGSRQNADDNEESDQDETTSSEEEDHEEDLEAELDTVVETLSPNQDTEVTEGINALREHYKALNRNILIPAANIPEKELHHGNEENDNSKGSEVENYLHNSDVESLDEEILEDGTTQMRRTPVRFPRYDENCRIVNFFIGLSFNDHTQFKRAMLKYVVQEKRDYEFVKNARQRVRVNGSSMTRAMLKHEHLHNFKWVWRFLTDGSSLWTRFIKAIFGNKRALDTYKLILRKCPWQDVILAIHSLQRDVALNVLYKRLYALEMCKSISVAEKMGHPSLSHSFRRMPRDRWCWSLEGSQEFSVKSSNTILPEAKVPTRWLRVVPIKVNDHAWRVCLDKLPTRANLSLRGMNIPSITCPLCNSAVEFTSHIFFTCPLACQVWRNFLIWWELEDVAFNTYNEWLNWIVNIRLHKQLKVFLE